MTRSLKVGFLSALMCVVLVLLAKLALTLHKDRTITWADRQEGGLSCMSLSPTCDIITAGSSWRTIFVWTVSEQRVTQSFLAHQESVCSVCFSPDGRYLASGGNAEGLAIWSTETWESIDSLPTSPMIKALSVGVGAKGRVFAGLGNGDIILWDRRARVTRELKGHQITVTTLSLFESSDLLLSGDSWGKIAIWHLKEKPIMTVLREKGPDVLASCFLGSATIGATGHDDGTIVFWDFNKRQERGLLRAHRGRITSLIFLPDKKTVVSAGADASIRLWKDNSGKIERIGEIQTEGPVQALAFCGKTQTMFAGLSNGSIASVKLSESK